MHIFVHSLEGDARSCFINLTTNTISNFQQLHEYFLRRWGKRKDPFKLLIKFNSLRKNDVEGVTSFNPKFLKSYHAILKNVRPLEVVAMTTYTIAHDSFFSTLKLIERHSSDLKAMFDEALEVEGNMLDSQGMSYL